MNKKTDTIINGVNAQDYYDGLLLKREMLDAEINTLEKSFDICSHEATEVIYYNRPARDVHGETIEKPYDIVCAGCGKLINSNINTCAFGRDE